MADDRTLLRYALRRRRTSLESKTLLASRRGAFSAAMQQFEELMSASAAVGPASRPITLYYATVQAGLAVAAAQRPIHGRRSANTVSSCKMRERRSLTFPSARKAQGNSRSWHKPPIHHLCKCR
jgi:hypothetical protein